jgi:phenylpyruvate tautomerase PptA (4-oxalocrotonate tautomerase family)
VPIIDIELLEDEQPGLLSTDKIQALADSLGDLFNSAEAGTWVRLRHLPRDRYAENQTRIDQSTRPVFITVLKSRLGDENELAAEAKAIAGTVSGILGRSVQNTHVLFQPDAAGRIAFGGELVRS